MSKNKKKNRRITPKKIKSDWHLPWWLRKIYRTRTGPPDKDLYFMKVCDYLEFGPVDKSLVLPAKNMRVHY